MSKILLDYVFPVSSINPLPQASTAFLKQVGLVCKPKAGQEGNVGEVFECVNMTQVLARTDSANAQQLFNAGMNKVYIILSNDLQLDEVMDSNQNLFFTLLVSDQFNDADLTSNDIVQTAEVKASVKIQDITYTSKLEGVDGNDISIEYADEKDDGSAEVISVTSGAILIHIEAGVTTALAIKEAIEDFSGANAIVQAVVDEGDDSDVQLATDGAVSLEGGVDEVLVQGDGISVGTFKGVIGVSSANQSIVNAQAVIENRCAFLTTIDNGAKNLCFAFGKLLSNQLNWLNQQYVAMPFNDGIDELGEAESLFENKASFVLSDEEFGNVLALFAVGGKAIVAPYILKNLMIDLQSKALTWISANQPSYTLKEASLLETRLQEDVINQYIVKKWISAGVVEISLFQDNFVASGEINVSEPKALWRVFSEMRQTL